MIDENDDTIITDKATEKENPPAQTPTADAVENDTAETGENNTDGYYEELLQSDMNELSEEFSANDKIKITDLKNPLRYGALRDLGLTPKEAYLASGGRKERADNRSHLSSSVPRKTAAPFYEIPRSELDAAREIFTGMSDSEIRNLYRKVTQ